MAIIHRISQPENESEAKAVKTLAEVLPKTYIIFHNFELCTGRGLPYEYDICVIGDFCVWHVEVKGYHGTIRGNSTEWVFENGLRQPSPIPLANKKSKIMASRIKEFTPNIWVETCILLTDDRACVRVQDDQADRRIVHIGDAECYFTDRNNLPVRTYNIRQQHDKICKALGGVKPRKTVRRIGLFDIIERINQTETRTVFLARHRYIRSRPMAIIKVFHFDVYKQDQDKQIEAIFHDREACRLMGAHPNIVDTWCMFAWDDDKYVLPTEYIDHGRPLLALEERQEDRDVPWATKADWILKMARGLDHAHSCGVVHRDISPLNVVVAPGGVVKLVNFDLAKVEGSPFHCCTDELRQRLNRTYVAPEVWVDPWGANARSDIYSLGALFYELIDGQPLYEDIEVMLNDSRLETPFNRERLKAALCPPRRNSFMGSPDDAVTVIERMMRRSPNDRHQNMSEVIEDLSILLLLDESDP